MRFKNLNPDQYFDYSSRLDSEPEFRKVRVRKSSSLRRTRNWPGPPLSPASSSNKLAYQSELYGILDSEFRIPKILEFSTYELGLRFPKVKNVFSPRIPSSELDFPVPFNPATNGIFWLSIYPFQSMIIFELHFTLWALRFSANSELSCVVHQATCSGLIYKMVPGDRDNLDGFHLI